MGAVLGIDYGEKRIGLAISTEDKGFVFSRDTINVIDQATSVAAIQELCESENVTEIVLGLPLDQNGDEQEAAQLVRKFGEVVAQRVNMLMNYQDERYSSIQSKQMMRESGANEKSMRGKVDQQAAILILETYLQRVYGQ